MFPVPLIWTKDFKWNRFLWHYTSFSSMLHLQNFILALGLGLYFSFYFQIVGYILRNCKHSVPVCIFHPASSNHCISHGCRGFSGTKKLMLVYPHSLDWPGICSVAQADLLQELLGPDFLKAGIARVYHQADVWSLNNSSNRFVILWFQTNKPI